MKPKPRKLYKYRGGIERVRAREGRVGTYVWHDGFSPDIDGCVSYPWMTRAECRRDAATTGHVAEFDR